jgi:16S rRNA (guanine966-N2)-methyltransferase
MRIIAGNLKGKKLFSPNGENTRPTTDRVKEGIFSAIQFDVEGKRVLDLFSGSGQMALEAISRGAEFAVLCDYNSEAIRTIKKNIDHTKTAEKTKIISFDFEKTLEVIKNDAPFGLVFLDPPYATDYMLKALNILCNQSYLTDDAMIICEIEKTTELPNTIGNFEIKKRYKYGSTHIVLFKKGSETLEDSHLPG